MKKSIIIISVFTLLSGCVGFPVEKESILSMSNPASEYCISKGGSLKIDKNLDGEVGYCILPNGQMIDEWAFFHESQEECITKNTEQLIGKKLTEPEIKEITHARVVRIVQPNQMVTADFQQNRVTILVDPDTNKVIKATCG